MADQVRVALDDESVADSSTGVMAEPDWSDWSPGLVTETVLVMFQVNEAVPAKPESSVAVTVTDDVPAVVGVPLMTPDEGVDGEAGGQTRGRVREGGRGRRVGGHHVHRGDGRAGDGGLSARIGDRHGVGDRPVEGHGPAESGRVAAVRVTA